MGTKIRPSVACLFMGYLAELLFVQYEHTTTILYKRYIDNTVGAGLCFQKELQGFINFLTNFNPSINYTHTLSDKTVTFLDLQLTIDNIHIKSCVHPKTDSTS